MSDKHTWLIANWKMNGTTEQVRGWAFAINAALNGISSKIACVLCPPMPYFGAAQAGLPQNAQLMIGAQNCHEKINGAYTGEVSAAMLKDCGCSYVIIGHSERRAVGETDEQVAAKAEAVMAADLVPIICIGEPLSAYEEKQTKQALDIQLARLATLSSRNYLIAYEPIWAIGTGKTPKMSEIAAAHGHIKSVLGSITTVLYGGSVNVGNIGEILTLPEVDGALIGGASLEISTMRAMLIAAATLRGK